MKVLMATERKTLDSRIARRFGRARWFLIVDLETMKKEVLPNAAPYDHHGIIGKAAERGVTTVITGNIGPHSYAAIVSHNLKVAHAQNMTAREALEKLQGGLLKVLDAPTLRKNVVEHEIHLAERRVQSSGGMRSGQARNAYASTTPRGQHHLQQYAGRGH